MRLFWKKLICRSEPIGLILLLSAFGWQCLEERSNQMKMEGYVYELNEKMFTIWEGVYDEALHSDRYHGKAMVSVNYDALYTHIKDWKQVRDGDVTIDSQIAMIFWIRVVLYVIGSVLIIIAKWPRQIE